MPQVVLDSNNSLRTHGGYLIRHTEAFGYRTVHDEDAGSDQSEDEKWERRSIATTNLALERLVHENRDRVEINSPSLGRRRFRRRGSISESTLAIFVAVACHLLIVLPLGILEQSPNKLLNEGLEHLSIQVTSAGPILTGVGAASHEYFIRALGEAEDDGVVDPSSLRFLVTLTWAIKGFGFLIAFAGMCGVALAVGQPEVCVVGIILLSVISLYWVHGCMTVYDNVGPSSEA
ncbi:hypothetical protein SISNIDRAFT_107474 [Sistotremastrum niveocremeum HHB9708]|uniref:Uncharacterized protein n=1 Tax=Sistotremastrum niveocremeum HHB9708 TaxID=1314777 RepID=A0A164TYA3_9AGAM|nr:hypothetical protein SISNIDRAFT_107474 [Sistotremastrum niveocremeum HHB9708]